MANLSLSQVRDAVERKRRRDLGSLRSPMDIDEGQYGLNDPSNPYLQGIDKAGLRNMTSAREVPSVRYGKNTRGQAQWGRGTGPQDWRPTRDIRILDEGLLSPEEYEDTMTHEVGHLGEQAVGNYRGFNDEISDRSHNMLYAPNVGGVIDPNDPYFGTLKEEVVGSNPFTQNEVMSTKGILSDRLGTSHRSPNPVAAQERLADVNRKSRDMQGLLDQDGSSASHDHSGHDNSSFVDTVKSKAGDLMTATKDLFRSGGKDNIIHDEPESRPTTLKQAQSQGKAHFWHDGKKKLAVTADQLAKFKKSDLYDADSKKSALSQWANVAQSEGGMKKLFQKKPDKQVAAEVKETKGQKQFLDDYMQTYYTGKKKDDPEFREDVKARLKGTVPDDHKETVSNAISSAVRIFGTDKLASGGRMDKATMKKMLQDLGQIESGYRTRIAGGGRPERGFWQVLPSTATDALKNAGAYFGPTFNKTFAGRPWVKSGQSPYESLKNMSQKDISKLLESDDALGAAFSAVQVLRTFKKKK